MNVFKDLLTRPPSLLQGGPAQDRLIQLICVWPRGLAHFGHLKWPNPRVYPRGARAKRGAMCGERKIAGVLECSPLETISSWSVSLVPSRCGALLPETDIPLRFPQSARILLRRLPPSHRVTSLQRLAQQMRMQCFHELANQACRCCKPYGELLRFTTRTPRLSSFAQELEAEVDQWERLIGPAQNVFLMGLLIPVTAVPF